VRDPQGVDMNVSPRCMNTRLGPSQFVKTLEHCVDFICINACATRSDAPHLFKSLIILWRASAVACQASCREVFVSWFHRLVFWSTCVRYCAAPREHVGLATVTCLIHLMEPINYHSGYETTYVDVSLVLQMSLWDIRSIR
jgi:hypothetical protein